MASVPVRLAYKTVEPASGLKGNLSPVIFLHGITHSKEDWGNIPQRLANETKRKVYAVDARNHGDSECIEEFNFDLNLVDLLHLLDTLKIEKAIFVGHSMGGISSMKAATKCPERIEKMVVEDMYAKPVPPDMYGVIALYINLHQEAFRKVPPLLDAESSLKFVVDYIQSKLPPELDQLDVEKEWGHYIAKMRREDGTYAMKCNADVIYRKIKEPEAMQSELQGSFKGPACFIYGTLSPFLVNKEKEHIQQHFPNAVFVPIEATHSVHAEKPEEFTAAVLKFLA